MTYDLHSLESLSAGLGAKNVKVQIATHWSSSVRGFRDNLRLALQKSTDCATVLDKTNLYRWENGFFSISHSDLAGGFAHSSNPIGLDIESAGRELSQKAYYRISDEEERQLGIKPIELWVAKEASFKAMNPVFYNEKTASPDFSLKTISQIKILAKTPLKDTRAYAFSFNLRDFNRLEYAWSGLIFSQNETCIGIAVRQT